MLPKKYKLPKKEIKEILNLGKTYNSDNFILKYRLNNKKECRALIIISLKVSKKATIRNLIKRRIHQILYLLFKTFEAKLDIVLIVKKTILDKTFKQIAQELNEAFKNLLMND
jgi:ribonuclease P protein component